MTHGDLFAGIGGFSLAARWCGIETVWAVEIEKFCQEVYRRHFPQVRLHEDIRAVDALPYVDLITGGFPCQPISCAGKRRGRDDPRWLWPEFARAIRMVRPRWVLVENVPGLRSANEGGAMGEVLGDLASLGYDAEWDCIPASAFGAPHRRDRVWIVAYASLGASGTNGEGISRASERSIACAESGWRTWRPGGRSSATCDMADAEIQAERLIFRQAWGKGQGEVGGNSSQIGWYDDRWATEPKVDRVAHGIPSRVDRLKGLGNAIVPQVAEWIMRRILEVDRAGKMAKELGEGDARKEE